ncbi:MAG: hypothetical protein WDZ88_01165 [Candidatus Paceibacterota bacterium]
MPRPLVQDVVPPNRRSIRDVSIDHHHRKRIRLPIEDEQKQDDTTPREPVNREYPKRGKSKGLFWVIIILGIVGLLFLVSMLFSGARVDVSINSAEVRIDDTSTAYSNPESPNLLAYQTVSVNKELSRTVPANGRELVQKRASGKITIYNNFSTQSQRLITNTRFETPEGLIYRIDRPVVVPGLSRDGETTTPGSIEVTVYADSPGEQYNISESDFTIPGFRGDPRYSAFYARTATPLSGGFSGEVNVASPEDTEAAREQLRTELLTLVEREIQTQYPDDFILYTDAIFTTFESLPDKDSSDGASLSVTEKATAHAFIFKKDDFSSYVARQTIGSYENEPIMLMNPQDLSFSIVDKDSVSPNTDTEFTFSLSGPARLVWEFDPEALKLNLVGKPKTEGEAILRNHKEIKTAQIVVRPFWKDVLPDREARIRIKVVSGE